MARGVASDECQNFRHKPKELTPKVARFFKILFDHDFTKTLYFPPEFVHKVKLGTGLETEIEDMNGQRWCVTVAEVEGALAIQMGWEKFCLDHNLKRGEILLFEYVKGGHFIVQIYGRSACERTNFKNEMPRKKRARMDHVTVSEDEPCLMTDLNTGYKSVLAAPVASKARKMQPFSESTYMEDLDCIIKKDDGCYQGEDRPILYELPNFELLNRPKQIILNSKLDPHSEIMELNKKLEKISDTKTPPPSHVGFEEQTRTMQDDVQMDMVYTCQTKDHSSDCFTDKLEEPLHAKTVPSTSDILDRTCIKGHDAEIAVVLANQIKGQSGNIVSDKPDKVVAKTVPSRSEFAKQAQALKKGDGIQTASIHSSHIASKFPKKFSESDLGRGMFDVPNGQNSKKNELDSALFFNIATDKLNVTCCFSNVDALHNDLDLKSYNESPSTGNSKISEGIRGVKRRLNESPVSTSVLKDLFGKNVIKNEQMEMDDEPDFFPQSSYGKMPAMVGEHGQMFSPAVKVEPDQSYDTGPLVSIIPFSAEVKSKSYLELPDEFPQTRRRERGRGKVVYLQDSVNRIWPVIYLEKEGLKVLTANWDKFCQGNKVKPGVVCRFQVVNAGLCLYRVDVNR